MAGGTTRRGWVLAGLMLTMTLSAMDNTIVATAIPQVVGELGGYALFGWVFSVYLLAQTVTIPIYGKLADLFGRKPVLIIGTVVFLVGSALSACSWNMVSLIAFRGLQGLGAGTIPATVTTLGADLYELRERGRVQGWLSSVWGVAAIVGPLLGGGLAQYASWRWIFLVNLPAGAAALFVIGRYLRENVTRSRHRIDYAGAVLILLAAGTLILGLLQGGTAWPWESPQSIGVFLLAAVLTAVAVVVERRVAEPVLSPWIWRQRALVGSNLGAIGLGLLVIGPSTFLPTYGQSVLGLGAIAAGFVLATMSITWPLASAQVSAFYLRIGFRDTAIVGAAIATAATAGFLLVSYPGSIWQPVVLTLALGAGFGLLSTPLVIGAQATVRWQRRGMVTGSVMFSRYLGQSLGAAVFGLISNTTLSARLHAAPATSRRYLPRDVNGVSQALTSHASAGGAAGRAHEYLRQALFAATHNVYAGLACVALATLLMLLVAPRRFPIVSDDDAASPEETAEAADATPA